MSIRNFLGHFAHHIPLSALVRASRKHILLPFYHTVSNSQIPHISPIYSFRNTHVFTQDLDFFCTHYKPISIQELYDAIDSNSQSTPMFHVSFDDGLREVYTVAAPILEAKGIPATFFVNTDFIDNTTLFYRHKVALILQALPLLSSSQTQLISEHAEQHHSISLQAFLAQCNHTHSADLDAIANMLEIDFENYLQTYQPYLTSEEILDLQKRGFQIASHSVNHPYFKNIDILEQKSQVFRSFSYLQSKFDCSDNFFSFPFSDALVTNDFFTWLHQDAHCKLSFGISGIKDDSSKYHLHRIPMEDSLLPAKKIIHAEYLYYLLKKLTHSNKIHRI